MFKPIQFTYEEVRIITNCFSNMMAKISKTGDYPEYNRDHKIKEKLLDWTYSAKSDINLATREAYKEE